MSQKPSIFENFESALDNLIKTEFTMSEGTQNPANKFDVCTPLSDSIPPSYIVNFRRPMPLFKIKSNFAQPDLTNIANTINTTSPSTQSQDVTSNLKSSLMASMKSLTPDMKKSDVSKAVDQAVSSVIAKIGPILSTHQLASLPPPGLALACVKIPSQDDVNVEVGFDLRFDQTWNVIGLNIGDLSSVMVLAPSEQLTLEFQQSQRKALDQDTIDQVEKMDSTESIIQDKDALNVTRASSRDENWKVDGQGSIDLGKLGSPDISASKSVSTHQSIQTTMDHITESTKKSSQSLKTMHKIEVRGVSETIIQNRMTRTIKNPYHDRTLSLNVFHLIKKYDVQTSLDQVRLAIIIDVNKLAFDNNFVVSYNDFLQKNILDQSLLSNLPTATQAAISSPTPSDLAENAAEMALHYLFDESNIFNMPRIMSKVGPDILQSDQNIPSSSFDATNPGNQSSTNVDLGGNIYSGFEDAYKGNKLVEFVTLNMFYKINLDRKNRNPYNLTALSVVQGIMDNLGSVQFQDSDTNLYAVLDNSNYTEIFRRLPGFLAVYDSMIKPLILSPDDEAKATQTKLQGQFWLSQIISHLNCNNNYYIQKFLEYLSDSTNNQAIIDFVNQIICFTSSLTKTGKLPNLISQFFDIRRAFISGQEIIIPSIIPLYDSDSTITSKDDGSLVNSFLNDLTSSQGQGTQKKWFDPLQLKSVTLQGLEVSTDGIHLEVTPGSCVLNNPPPPPPQNSASFSLQNASLNVGGS